MKLKTNTRATAAVLSSALALALSPLATQIAFADPASCSKGTPTIDAGFGSQLIGQGSGFCDISGVFRTFSVEIKWNKNFAPDPLVAKNSTSHSRNSYGVTTSSCDAGNTRGYYSRSYFSQTPSDHADSAARTLTAC